MNDTFEIAVSTDVERLGALAVSLLALFYALEPRSPYFTLLFSDACLASSAYAAAIGSLPFAVVEVPWAAIAVKRFLAAKRRAPNGGDS